MWGLFDRPMTDEPMIVNPIMPALPPNTDPGKFVEPIPNAPADMPPGNYMMPMAYAPPPMPDPRMATPPGGNSPSMGMMDPMYGTIDPRMAPSLPMPDPMGTPINPDPYQPPKPDFSDGGYGYTGANYDSFGQMMDAFGGGKGGAAPGPTNWTTDMVDT
jgi:hypothetical protein